MPSTMERKATSNERPLSENVSRILDEISTIFKTQKQRIDRFRKSFGISHTYGHLVDAAAESVPCTGRRKILEYTETGDRPMISCPIATKSRKTTVA